MTWYEMKRLLDHFLIEAEGIPRHAGVPEIYNSFCDYAAARGVRIRNPENAMRVLDYLSERRECLWDGRKREALGILVRADDRYDRTHHVYQTRKGEPHEKGNEKH